MAPKQIVVPIMIQQQYFFRLLLFSWHDIRHFLVVSKEEEEEEEGMVEKGELPISLSRVRTHGPRGLYSRLQTFFPLNLESGRKIAKLGLGRAHLYHSLNSSKIHLDYIFFDSLMQERYIHWIQVRFRHFCPVCSNLPAVREPKII